MKRGRLFKNAIALIMCFAMLLGCSGKIAYGNIESVQGNAPRVLSVLADKARYNPGETAFFNVEVQNNNDEAWSGLITLEVYHLENPVDRITQGAYVGGNATETICMVWNVPVSDYTGYLVKAYIGAADNSAVTALDCSSDISVFPRYGYVADYSAAQTTEETASMIDELAEKYHINAYQLYDWMWRHDELIKRDYGTVASNWSDLFNREISTNTIRDYITSIHANNGAAMAYVMSYAAREGYSDFGIDANEGLYTDKNHLSQLNVDFGNNSTYLWLFNPQNKQWQNTMSNQYTDAINTFGFDGLQIDQMGQRNDVYDYRGQKVYLEDTFSSFVNSVKKALTANNSSKDLVTFNIVDGTVDGWAMTDVVEKANTDFNFSEIWWLSNSYSAIRNYIEQVKSLSDNKALVLAAYMNYRDNCGERLEAENASLNGVSVNTDHYGYSGNGFVDGFSDIGDSVTFNVNVDADGLYAFVFTYANAAVNATRKVYVDDTVIDLVSFSTLNSWDEWSDSANCSAYLTAGTHTVRVSYDYDCAGAINLDAMTLGEFDENSIRLADATFAASGAQHIELGAGKQLTMLAHEYYPMKSKTVSASLRAAMKNHYDFITAYENLLYGKDVFPSDTGLQFISVNGEEVSGSGEAGKIWYIGRQSEDYSIIHLINLTGENDNEWRNATNAPIVKNSLDVKYYIPEETYVSGVYVASPDRNSCETESLQYTFGYDGNGKYVQFTVPSLEYWDMVYIRRAFTTTDLYEAENAVRSGVAVNNDHPGYSGIGFVDSFGEMGDSVGFEVYIPQDGIYTMKLKYANATNQEAVRAVILDGKYVKKAYFASNNDWNSWMTTEVGLELKSGVHTFVVYYGEYENGAINLDSLEVVPNEETARSLYMNNWKNLVAIWEDTQVNQVSPKKWDGPSLYELRYYDGTENGNYNTNLIKNYSTFIKDMSTGAAYTSGAEFSSTGYFDTNGILVNEYQSYAGNELPVQLTKKYAMIPDKQFIIVDYELTNRNSYAKTIDIVDMLHVNNNSDNDISAAFSEQTDAMYINMSSAGTASMVHGILSGNVQYSYQAANDTISDTNSTECSPWYLFNYSGNLRNNSNAVAKDISSAFQTSVTIAPGSSEHVFFYVGVGENEYELQSMVNEIRMYTGEYWQYYTGMLYSQWLSGGILPNNSESELVDAYNSISVFMKQSIVPGTTDNGKVTFAALPATTNPSAYSYKVWARDSAVTAMSIDATGHLAEAENYWYWLADRQIVNDEGGWKKPGTFWTCYWIWDNGPVSFVEPEYDSIGMFLVGAYRHYEMLSGDAKEQFLNRIWPAYRRSADFVLMNIGANGFGPADCGIWEEQSEYNTFTQGLYVSGLDAAQHMATAMGLQDVADMYNGGASTIRSAILRDDNGSNPGSWNVAEGKYNRALSLNGTPNSICDSSSDTLISYGVIDAESTRAKSHIDKITEEIGHDKYGVARYENDGFYHRMPWDPGGNEALEDEPSWPQMAMWMGMYEIRSGYDSYYANALERLRWFVNRTAKGYMPQGENFSNITLKPHISTMCEPITGAAYLMTLLAYSGQFDMRVYSPQVNAGVYKQIYINGGCYADWEQWSNVPYYTDKVGDNIGEYDIKRVALANDSSNIYLKIDTTEWNLPGYCDFNTFAVRVVVDDTYLLTRNSYSDAYALYRNVNGSWQYDRDITSVIAPQWEPESGRIEMAIPYEAIGCSYPSEGMWNNLKISITQGDGVNGLVSDTFKAHYRMTGCFMEWLLGNFE